MTHYGFNLEDFVWDNLQHPEGYSKGEFFSQRERGGQRETDAGFHQFCSDLLKKLIKPRHNKPANIHEFSSTLIAGMTAGYIPQMFKVNANQSEKPFYGVINPNKNISAHTLAEGIRCWWPNIVSFSLMASTYHLIKDWPPLWCRA